MTTTIVTKGIETKKINTTNKGFCGGKYSLADPYIKEQPHSRMLFNRDMVFYLLGLQKPKQFISDGELNAIVSALGIGNNIVNNYFDGVDNGDEDITDKLSQEQYLMGRINLVEAAGKFQWYEERGIDLNTLDSESVLEGMENKLSEMAQKGRQWRERLIEEYGDAYKTKRSKGLQRLAEEYKQELKKMREYELTLDMRLAQQEEKDATDLSESEWTKVYLESRINKMAVWELAATVDILDELKKNNKLSWYWFLECSLAVVGRLCKATKNRVEWVELWDRLLRNKRTHHSNTYASPTLEDSVYGSCSLSADMAVDDIIAAKRLADTHGISEQEVIATWDTEVDPDMLSTGSGSAWECMLAAAQVG